jgi:SAM-dependent methyltransferase
MSKNTAETWHQDFYDDLFAQHCLQRSEKEVNEAVDFLMDKLSLKAGMRFFDQGCGLGTLSLALARKGLHVTGVDLINSYITRAQAEAAAENLACDFHTGNAYDFVPSKPCDAAINWWTSFGYSENDDKNILMMQRIFEALKPGGFFGFDYKNGARVLKDFAQSNTLRDVAEKDGHKTVWESRYEPDTNMVYKDWIYTAPDGTHQENKGGGAKLYTAEDITHLLTEAGFVNIKFYGDMQGGAFDPDTSIRCITISEKPAGA